MPKVSGSRPFRLRAATTRARAAAETRGSARSPCASHLSAAWRAVVTVMALPLRPRLNGARIGTRTWPRPRLEATATGAKRCAASNWPILSRSRTLDQEISRTSSTSRPWARAKPLSTATIKAAASASGMKPIFRGTGAAVPTGLKSVVMSALEKVDGAYQTVGDVADSLAFTHGGTAQKGVSRLLVKSAALHQDAFGFLDHLALFKRAFGLLEFGAQPFEGAKTGDRHVENG